MSDDQRGDEQLRRLIGDAVSDIEPRDRLHQIRASVHPDPEVVPMTRPRPWLYAVSGAVASAAVIGVIAYTTHVLSGPDHPDSGLAGPGHGSRPTTAASTETAIDSQATSAPTSATTATSAPTAGDHAYAVYYVGANAFGRPVLFREFHRGPALPIADPEGNGGDVLTEAVHDAMATEPLDPDYRTPWHDLATLKSAYYTSTGAGYTLAIQLTGHHLTARPSGMSAAEARAAVQQLVYTAQAAIGKRVPVGIVIGRHTPRATLLGVPTPGGFVSAAPVTRTLSLVNISSPGEGDQVSGLLRVTGVNNAFEGTSVVYLERNGRHYLTTPATGGFGGNKLYPWTVTLDLTRVQPGEYTLVAENPDDSGRGRPDTDTRTLEVK